jgi:hypothetical protein
MPVDFLIWSALAGEPLLAATLEEDVVRRLQDQIQPYHHIVDIGVGLDLLFDVLAESRRPPRSLVTVGYLPLPATARALGKESLAAALGLTFDIARGGQQNLHAVMQDADEDYVLEQARLLEQDVDPSRFFPPRRPGAVTATVDVPALHLSLPLPVVGFEDAAEIYRHFVPHAQFDELKIWPLRLHEEEGGHELESKVIPFIKEVIAARKTASGSQ